MTIRTIAKTIPIELRQFILKNGTIDKAISVSSNPEMQTLLNVWHQFIEPNREVSNCPICIANILTNFKQMREDLVELEHEHQYLESL